MVRLLFLYFMKGQSVCICGIPTHSNEKYCNLCIRDREWEVFLKPGKKEKNSKKQVGDRIDVEKKIAQLVDALKMAKKDLLEVKRQEKEEKLMMEQQQIFLKKFSQNVPQLQQKIRKKILA